MGWPLKKDQMASGSRTAGPSEDKVLHHTFRSTWIGRAYIAARRAAVKE